MSRLDPGETFGEVAHGPATGASLSRHGPHQALPRHEHAQAYVCVVLGGGFSESGVRGEARHGAGEVIVHAAGEAHADAFGPSGALCLNLHLTGGDLDPQTRRVGAALACVVDALAAEVAKGERGDRLTAEGLSAEVIDTLRRPETPKDPDAAGRALLALGSAPEVNWTLSDLAAVAGRHPSHLARAFRLQTGMTLGAYRRRRRLVGLCLDLRLSPRPLAQLALDHGYADQAHMCREFRGFTGITPGGYRRQAR